MNSKAQIAILLFCLSIYSSNDAQALDFNVNSLSKMFLSLAGNKTYIQLQEQLRQEYLESSQKYASAFKIAAEKNSVNLKKFLCNTENPSSEVAKLQAFQTKSYLDFQLNYERDFQDITYVLELQNAYQEICKMTNDTPNDRVAKVMAETLLFPIYNATRIQLLEFFDN